MKLSGIKRVLGVLVLAGSAGSPAVAEDAGWYVGGNLGRSMAKIDDHRINKKLLGAGFTSTSIDDDDRDSGYKLFGGYQFNDHFAVEGGYFDLGDFGYTATTVPPGTVSGKLDTHGINLDLVGLLNVNEKLALFARFGANYAKTDVRFSDTGRVHVLDPRSDERDFNYKYGFGLQYALTRSLGLRVELERYRINDAVGNMGDIDLASIGLVYRFGQPAPLASTAEPKRQEPEPEPVLVVVPTPVAAEQYCTILDFQFEINRSDIQLEDLEKLSVIGTFLNKYPETTAVIEGHTDNIGTPEDNLALSQSRADSVVDYIVKNKGIDRSRLKAVGYGDSRPLGDNSTDAGKRQNRRINAVVACATDIEDLKPVAARTTMALQMEFDTNDTAVRPMYKDELEKVANHLKANPGVNATVEGHTSNKLNLSAEESMALSQHRAASVVSYLVDNFGIDKSRLIAQGFGEQRRFSYNTTAEGQQDNQRVNIIFDYHP